MGNSFLFTALCKTVTLFVATFAITSQTHAQIMGPSVTEVRYSYRTSFQVPTDNDHGADPEVLANFHASHIFGIFSSPTVIKRLVGRNAVIGGVGAPRSQMRLQIHNQRSENGVTTIEYSNSGKMILHKNAARKLIAEGKLTLPLPTNPYEIYDKKCTDSHYDSFGDFWYFYDPYRRGCDYLSRAPKATPVEIRITEFNYRRLETTPRLPTLRGNNGNGDLFSVYIISGYYEDGSDADDPGYENFREIQAEFERRGFSVRSRRGTTRKPINVYTKSITLDNGKNMDIEVQHLLIDTGIETRSKVFAKFFKEAVETADIVVYGGHSGLGANLDIPSLEAKAGSFTFNKNKKQIFFFDSCSSYSYYLEHFSVEKTKAKIDILSNGLSSYFHTSNGVLFAFLDRMFSTDSRDVEWMTLMNEMEETLEGDSYLLNVGGI